MNELAGARTTLGLAGALSIGLGGFHLWLPRLFDWHAGMAAAPASLRWACGALNAFWSLLAIGTGTIAWRLAWRDEWRSAAGRFVAGTLAGYWSLHAAYLVAWPFPLPPRLAWLGIAFLSFAVLQAALHGWPAVAGRIRTPKKMR